MMRATESAKWEDLVESKTMNLDRMHVTLIEEAGYFPAIFGNGLSFGKTSHLIYNEFKAIYDPKTKAVNESLAKLDRGHDGFLSMIHTWWDINAPRDWWQQADTYKIGKCMRSESTMHTLMNPTVPYHVVHQQATGVDLEERCGVLEQEHFIEDIPQSHLAHLNRLIAAGDFRLAKKHLPEGFLQRRIVNLSVMCLKNMIIQRQTHKLPEWGHFISSVLDQVSLHIYNLLPHPRFNLEGDLNNDKK